MTGRSRACRPSPSQQTGPGAAAGAAVPAQRYNLAISGVHQRTISGDAAEMTFRRWRQSPDVIMRGDLRTGFCWEWANGVRFTIKPVPDGTPVPDQIADIGRAQRAAL
jgi:hypothetical protein